MKDALKACAALFASFGVLVVGHGLLSSLLGVRLTNAGYGTDVSGLVSSGFFIGIISAGLFGQKIISRVGHVRVFGAMAALGAISSSAHSLLLDPWLWALLRAITGFATTTMYIIVESWVNDRADNRFRGRLLSVYMVIWYIAMMGGQGLLALDETGDAPLFVIAAMLYSLGALPLLLAGGKAPAFAEAKKLPLRVLLKTVPLGPVGGFMVGVLHGTLISLGAVYAAQRGLPAEKVAIFMSAIFVGGILLQFPIGRLSDHRPRHLVLATTSLAAAAFGLLTWWLSDDFWAMTVSFCIFGGLNLPLYVQALAVASDHLSKEQMIGAAATMNLSIGLGGMVGPAIAGQVMALLGIEAFFPYQAALMLLMVVLALTLQRGKSTQ